MQGEAKVGKSRVRGATSPSQHVAVEQERVGRMQDCRGRRLDRGRREQPVAVVGPSGARRRDLLVGAEVAEDEEVRLEEATRR